MAETTKPDRDSRLRRLKHDLAAAETAGDTEAADAARRGIADVREEAAHANAAATRREATEDGKAARTAAPQGRGAPPKATTSAPAKAAAAKAATTTGEASKG